MSCAWCHNPEMQRAGRQILFYPQSCIYCGACVSACPSGAQAVYPERIFNRDRCKACGSCVETCCTNALVPVSRDRPIDEILSIVFKDQAFYREAGGVTLSGGEPLLHGQGTVALLKACKETGLTTAVETCGYFDGDLIPELVPEVDLFLWDIKDTDDERHRAYTGVSNRRILENLRRADALGGRTRLRCILVTGVNTDERHYTALAELALGLSHCEGVELIPYHAYAGSKMIPLGLPDNGRAEWIPDEETVARAVSFLRERGVRVCVNGEYRYQ